MRLRWLFLQVLLLPRVPRAVGVVVVMPLARVVLLLKVKAAGTGRRRWKSRRTAMRAVKVRRSHWE